MAQTVNEVTDLMSGKTRRPNSGFQVPTPVKYFFMVLVLALLILILIMGGKALRDAPPAAIHVSNQDLTVTQHRVLSQTMEQQQISSFFTSDLQALRDIAVGLAWVDQVSVSRDWQRGIVIKALPKQAVANFGTERLVDAKGAVFVPADSRDLTQERFATLQGERSQAPVIMQQMQQVNDWYAPLDIQVEDIILSPRMTWLIRFDSGLRVIVDNEDTAQKLLNLSQLLGNQLSSRRDEIQSVDLRYKNGFTISWDMAQSAQPNQP
ncbi:cell division protein FtsQ/DivIB [Psychrobacter sp.]|uniref:cell division protein FtsQ/DivIB n=1 Tax=Psychrobacter sp. TaxID=56811 RepID=UPI002649EF1B|nr:cell division protein FtsQ/DivIB [Psychrobacter sp.]MDN6276807.1 cell division protein FtsQ [Psychrobacter sp.]MDN6308677.1 cell division protein FtsQ [Psychrobacter sp.]